VHGLYGEPIAREELLEIGTHIDVVIYDEQAKLMRHLALTRGSTEPDPIP